MKIEAERLLGREIDDEEFEKLNHVYMESRYDKVSVCKTWGSLDDKRVLLELAETVAHIREEYSKFAASHRDLFAVVKRNQNFLENAESIRIGFRGGCVSFNRELMRCLVLNKHLEVCFNAKLFNVPDCHRRLKYESNSPIPKEAIDLLALMGYEVDGPL